MPVRMNASGEMDHDEEVEQIIEDIEEGITYGDLEEEYGEFRTFLAANGPDSVVMDEDETVYFGEFSLAAAGEIEEDYFSIGMEKRDAAATLGGGAAGVGLGVQFLRTGEPAWLASSLISLNLVKDSTGRIYNDISSYRERMKDQEEGIEKFKEDFEDIEHYEAEINEEKAAQAMESIGLEEITEALSDDDLDSGMAFQ